ncbi:MAG: hypothetical protein ACRBCI_15655 [Cellvibrionaceae bacterium]
MEEIIFSHWVPVLIAGTGSFIIAWIIRGIDRNQAFKDKRIEHGKETIASMSAYIQNWQRLRSIAQLSHERALSEEEQTRLNRYVDDRDKAKETLVACINMMPLFFEQTVVKRFSDFYRWDQQQAANRINELAPISYWESWMAELSKLLRENIKK